ncbi:MAG: hypothetical protein RLP15_03080 [Cryomorphaceae bacterium]
MNEEVDIDKRLYNSETGEPFECCLVCNVILAESGDDYFVERIFRRLPSLGVTEAIFEYALCMSCAENMRNDLSSESKEQVERFFETKLRQRTFLEPSTGLDTCLLTGKPIVDSEEFSYHGHCRGNKMLRSIFPYAISDSAMDEISELLSDETTDQLNDFKGRYFTGPPEYADLLNPNRLLPI